MSLTEVTMNKIKVGDQILAFFDTGSILFGKVIPKIPEHTWANEPHIRAKGWVRDPNSFGIRYLKSWYLREKRPATYFLLSEQQYEFFRLLGLGSEET